MKSIYIMDITPSHIGSMTFFLCDLSKKLGNDFMIGFTGQPTAPLKAFFQENNCRYILVPKSPAGLLKVALQYNRVLTGFFRFPSWIALLLKIFRIQYVYVHHDSFYDKDLIIHQPKLKRQLKKIKLKTTYLLVSKVVCVSNFIVKELSQSGISRKKLICIHNGVSIDRQAKLNNQAWNSTALAQINKGKNKIKCIFIGSLEYFKGVDVILRTAPLVPNVDFYIAGTGSLKEQVIESAKNCDNVFYLGVVQNFILLAKYFNFAIVPSRWHESFCYTAVEAQYAKLPVIASTKGALPEVLQPDNVVFIESIHENDLCQAISKMISYISDTTNNQILKMPFTLEKQTEAFTDLLRS